MIIENKKPVYIMSLEASDIYYHNYRGMDIKKDYYGMIPFSLELIKLIETGFKTKYIESRDKHTSDDIINVQFKTKAKKAEDMLSIVEKRIQYIDETKEKNKDYLDKMISFKESLQEHSIIREDGEYWDEVTVEEMRHKLYSDGFSITFVNPKTQKERVVEYVVYKRSSAKSRTGQCLFIKKSLYKKMISWSRMFLPFKKGDKVDLAGLLAYESLVGSSLEDTIEIDSNKILIVDDLDSKFNRVANVVKKNDATGFLDSFKEETEIVNSLFDGESLLDKKYFKDNQSMMLLRNHMFKSASFNTNIQEFFKDNCPKDTPYNEWTIEDMYGNKMLAKDIDMIITPNSLKALKFKGALPSKTEKEMWDYWKMIVQTDGDIFGICKHEKQSKLGKDSKGSILQQTSYQMINCLPVNNDDISDLLSTEQGYIERLKNDEQFLISEIEKDIDLTNSNESIVGLYNVNNDFAKTGLFKSFKKDYVYNKGSHAKKGKIKIHGDYSVLLGNPVEFLYHSIGVDVLSSKYKSSLMDNEVYCPMFPDNEDLVGFRNPNTSPSNVLVMKNKKHQEIDKYFNLTPNIIAVNAIEFPIQDILSGCDYDSDTMLVSNEKKLVEIGKRCFNKYDVCVNHIEGQKKEYRLTNEDHYEIDNQLSSSQRIIGRVVNLGQFCMSIYWDLINKGSNPKEVEELLKKVDVMTILSGIAIDMAKKFYELDMMTEIKFVEKNELISKRKNKPNFWVSVSQNKSIKDKVEHYECPMDFLIDNIQKFNSTKRTPTIELGSLIQSFSTKNVNLKQLENIKFLLEEYTNELGLIKKENSEYAREKIVNLENDVGNKIKGWKIKAETISVLLEGNHSIDNKALLKTIKFLYIYHQEELLKVFIPSKN